MDAPAFGQRRRAAVSRRARKGHGAVRTGTVFTAAEGLSQRWGSRTRTLTDLERWTGKRGVAGRGAPHSFPRNNRFAGTTQ